MSSLKEIIAAASDKFCSVFGSPPKFGGHGSGRVNLIGEHTDYNDGLVLPMALPLHTVMIGNLSDSSVCRIHTLASVDGCQDIVFQLDQLQSKDSGDEETLWAKYVKGVIDNFPNKQSLKPFNAVIATSVPLGAGLSSSAALEVATFYFLESLMPGSTSELDIVEKAKICQKAEHDWVGVPCGLMDQLVSFSGQENHALLIDCRSNSIEYVPLPPEDQYVFVVANSHVKHEHASNEYVNRRRSCEQVSSLLAKSSLRDISMRELESSLTVLPEDLYRIARHVITENERTLNAADALKRNHLTVFGALMTQSHISLRDDYQVSCPELDELVEIALETEGVLGSRMTGGGFGGSTVTLVSREKAQELMDRIQSKVSKGHPSVSIFSASSGGAIIDL